MAADIRHDGCNCLKTGELGLRTVQDNDNETHHFLSFSQTTVTTFDHGHTTTLLKLALELVIRMKGHLSIVACVILTPYKLH